MIEIHYLKTSGELEIARFTTETGASLFTGWLNSEGLQWHRWTGETA